MTILLNILLALALLFLVLTSSGGYQGSHQAAGSFILILFACVLMGLALLISTFTGRLGPMPGGELAQLALSFGVIVCVGVAAYYSIAEQGSLPVAAGVAPYLLWLGTILSVNRTGVMVSKITLGAGGLAGWVLMGVGLVSWIRLDIRNNAAAQRATQERDDQFARDQTAYYRSLPADASLGQIIGCTWARDENLRNECIAKVSAWPHLDDELIALIDHDNQDGIDYVANVYQEPPARLGPAWGAMMERQYKEWEPQLLAEYGAKWEPNISVYFEGAKKLQKSGADLRPQLRQWVDLLKKVKGLEGMTAVVQTML
jgi:hypothetical protein